MFSVSIGRQKVGVVDRQLTYLDEVYLTWIASTKSGRKLMKQALKFGVTQTMLCTWLFQVTERKGVTMATKCLQLRYREVLRKFKQWAPLLGKIIRARNYTYSLEE